MNIILDKSLKTDSKQPKVFELGKITTTLQDLLDNSSIVINGEQLIVLSIINKDNNDNIKYLLSLDYKGESFYGLGKNILETDLTFLGNIGTKSYKVYTALLNQTGTNPPIPIVLENTLGGNPIWAYNGIGVYRLTINNAFTINKTTIDLGISTLNILGRGGWRNISNSANFVEFITYNNSNVSENNLLVSTLFEIRVYN